MAEPDGKEFKTAAVAVRTTPTMKALLKEAADKAGRSVTQEIERRLELSLTAEKARRSVETEALLVEIANRIDQIEQALGHSWTTDAKTWGAVTQMLREGITGKHHPIATMGSAKAKAAIEASIKIEQSKKPYLDLLRFAGVDARETAPKRQWSITSTRKFKAVVGLSDGPLGREYRRAMESPDPRAVEREAVRALGLSASDEEMLLAAVDKLQELDAESSAAINVAREDIDAVYNAIREGQEYVRSTNKIPKLLGDD